MTNTELTQFFYKKSRIQQFKGFCKVMQYGSMLKASQEMGLDPSTISLQIRSLEKDLDMKLFERTRQHRLIPTEQALRLYKKLIPIVQNVEGVLKEFLNEEEHKNNKNLKIAGHHVAISHILPKYIKQYIDRYPDAKVEVSNVKKKEAIDQLIQDKHDLIVFPTEKNEKIPVELISIEILKYEPVLIMHKNHPLKDKDSEKITVKDIAKYNLIHMDKFIVFKTLKHWIKEYNMSSNVELINGSWEIMKNFVSQGIGITGFDKIYINKKRETDLVCKDIKHLMPEMNHSILIRKNANIKENIEDFIRNIKDNLNKDFSD